jgi:DNA-binding CsgD family transcriptional regulator
MNTELLYPKISEFVCKRRREEVLLGIWEGRGTKEIAADLGISPKTVEYHRAQLYRVFGVGDLVSLCRRAMALGLIRPDPCCGGEAPNETDEPGRTHGKNHRRAARRR